MRQKQTLPSVPKAAVRFRPYRPLNGSLRRRTLASSARLLLALVPVVGTRLILAVRERFEEIAASDQV